MYRSLFLLLLFVSFLQGDFLHKKIQNLIGNQNYNIHKNLISLLLKDRYKFESRGQIRYYNLIKTLRENGLMDLKLSSPRYIQIEFAIVNRPLKGYKLLKETLENIGYRYYFTTHLEKNGENTNKLFWKIKLKTEYMLNPQVLLKELQQKNCKISNIVNRGNNSWYYELDFSKAKVYSAVKIDKDEKLILQKPLKPYFLTFDKINSVTIISRKLNNWFPYIVFFDKDLNTLKVIKKNRVYKGFRANAPKGTKYMKISDSYNLINIKRGLSVIAR